ncbi:MAG: TauD/TfdA family dioxygenase, partial [Pseudomonadota bacterium]
VKSRPEVMFFMCEKPADSDGETTVCDGIAVYHALSDSTRKLLDEKRLKYIRHYTESEWQTLYQTDDFAVVEAYCRDNDMTLERTDDNGIHTAFIQSAVPPTKWQGVPSFCNSLLIGLWQEYDLGRKTTFVRFEDDSEITPALRQELEEVSERLTANVPWEAGDIAIVDNTRMLHGRRAFTDDDRAVLARMCRSVSW